MTRWFVYILECGDRTLYTGIATDLEKRLELHRRGTGAKYTRGRLPVALVYQESRPDRSSALKREAQLKRLGREAKLALINAPSARSARPAESRRRSQRS
jgi:predicted GIY-YIG superfamily endonuclease